MRKRIWSPLSTRGSGFRCQAEKRKSRKQTPRASHRAVWCSEVCRPPEFRRLMAYLVYSPEFEFYADNSDEDTESHHLEASFQYRFRGGLTVGILDQFLKTHDERGTGFTTILDEYTARTCCRRLFHITFHPS